MCRYIIVRRDSAAAVVEEHDVEEVAKLNAQELAQLDQGTAFEVYQIIGTAILEPKVVWKGAKP